MTCIKTGADVYLVEHGAIVHGDLYEVGDVYILACAYPVDNCMTYEPSIRSLIQLRIRHYEYCGYRSIAMLKEHCSDFNYEGWTLV